MGSNSLWSRKHDRISARASGFTIVELLIVIVVIAILAAVSVVAYVGVQDRAHDAKRRSDVVNIAKMLQLVAVKKGTNAISVDSGCGGEGQGSGYFTSEDSAYPRSIQNCLVDWGFPEAADIYDPSGCDVAAPPDSCIADRINGRRYMVAYCTKNSAPVGYALAHVKSEPAAPELMSSLCDADSKVTGFGTNGSSWSHCTNQPGEYCINYYAQIF